MKAAGICRRPSLHYELFLKLAVRSVSLNSKQVRDDFFENYFDKLMDIGWKANITFKKLINTFNINNM